MYWKRWFGVAAIVSCLPAGLSAQASHAAKAPMGCSRVVFDGDVKAGMGFEKVFAKGLKFYLEPLRSGWIVRVLAADEPRGPHDYAELATPPYRSVSPLLISTDWSFRAQDAVAWNPRRFRYARSGEVFRQLAGLYGGVMSNDASSSSKVAEIVSEQPEGVLQILDARMVPGLADQALMASAVASHLEETPLEVDQSVAPSTLGRIEELRFRVKLDLPAGIFAAPGLVVEKNSATCQPVGDQVHPSN